MTVASSASKKRYVANGTLTAFPFPYAFFERSDLVVYVVPPAGSEMILTLDSDYAVSPAIGTDYRNGGTVAFIEAPAAGTVIVINRVLPYTQETDLVNNEAFHAETLESAHDRSVMLDQQIKEELSRCFKINITSDEDLDPDELMAVLLESSTIAQKAAIVAALAQTAAETAKTAAETAAANAATEVSNALTNTVNPALTAQGNRITAIESKKIFDASQMMYVRDEKASGTAGGTATTGAWRTRDLNTVKVNTIAGASMSGNQIILPAGTYYARSTSTSYAASMVSRLYDVTHGVALQNGHSGWVNPSYGGKGIVNTMGTFTLASTSVISLESWIAATMATYGWGYASSMSGFNEIYSEVEIWKVS